MYKFRKSLCIVLAGAMMLTSMTGCSREAAQVNAQEAAVTVNEETVEDSTEGSEEKQETADKLEETLTADIDNEDTDTDKEETVYILSDAKGNPNQIIVSNWLKNPDKAETLTDYTELSDVENVKGYEDYTENADGTITWQAGGSDIYYQGTTDKELPVDVKVSYKLDGQDIEPSELAGKSGRVTIRFDYTNNTAGEVVVNGVKKQIITPFVMLSGVVLPTDKFSNVEIVNGTTISEGDNIIAAGYAVPGLKDCLVSGIEDDTLGNYIEDMEVPDYVEITADVQDFSLTMTMSVAVTGLLSDGSIDMSDIDISELTDQVDTLGDSAEQLVDGSGELKNGLESLKAGTYSLNSGAASLVSGTSSLKNYTASLADGTEQLENAIGSLNDGIDSLVSGSYALNDAGVTLSSGAQTISDGVDNVYAGENQLKSGAESLIAGYEGNENQPGAVAGAEAVESGASDLKEGITQLLSAVSNIPSQISASTSSVYSNLAAYGINVSSKGEIAQMMAAYEAMDTLSSGDLQIYKLLCASYYTADTLENTAATLQNSMDSMSGDMAALSNGADALASGASDVSDGVTALYNGTKELYNGIETLMTGTETLAAGADSLASGAATVSEKLGELYSGSVALSAGGGQLETAAGTLNSGASAIYDGAITLDNGMKTFANGVSSLDQGADQLVSGSFDLAEGMDKFNEEGIKKITELFSGDYQTELDFIEKLFGEESEYVSYSGIVSGKRGSVRFIYETEAIE